MKVLVITGVYKEGKLFGKEAAGEYLRKYTPPRNLLGVVEIQDPASMYDPSSIERPNPEIILLASRLKPKIIMDIRISGGWASEAREHVEAGGIDKIVESVFELAPEMPDWMEEAQRAIIEEKVKKLKSIMTTPLSYILLNPDNDRALSNYLVGQEDAAMNVIDDEKVLREVTAQVPWFDAINRRGTSYLATTSMLDDIDGGVESTEHADIAFKKTIEFIHRIRNYAESYL